MYHPYRAVNIEIANLAGSMLCAYSPVLVPYRYRDELGTLVRTRKMGLSYNKRRNMIELAVVRGCTAKSSSALNQDDENREGHPDWPGMMSVRVHELDGVYDHPVLPMAGESCQLLEIQCHSKLAAKRIQKPKKGSKADGSDDNADVVSTQDMRSGRRGREIPLARCSSLVPLRDPLPAGDDSSLAGDSFSLRGEKERGDINQLEKDKDVVAQSQAISMLEMLPQLSFAVVNALNSFLNDSKVIAIVRGLSALYRAVHTGWLADRYADCPLSGGTVEIDRRQSISAVDGRLREKEEEGEEAGETCFAVRCYSLVPLCDPSPAGDSFSPCVSSPRREKERGNTARYRVVPPKSTVIGRFRSSTVD
ncbi:hypothetical protein GW17_00000512 [Ensete ventricosum]|nr:hypothetical protein GW17_00000512 [Ensete ventricosum]